jgi:hypothetical protein
MPPRRRNTTRLWRKLLTKLGHNHRKILDRWAYVVYLAAVHHLAEQYAVEYELGLRICHDREVLTASMRKAETCMRDVFPTIATFERYRQCRGRL